MTGPRGRQAVFVPYADFHAFFLMAEEALRAKTAAHDVRRRGWALRVVFRSLADDEC